MDLTDVSISDTDFVEAVRDRLAKGVPDDVIIDLMVLLMALTRAEDSGLIPAFASEAMGAECDRLAGWITGFRLRR